MSYQYVVRCVDALGEDIIELQDLADEMDNDTFLSQCATPNEITRDVLDRLGYEAWAQESDETAESLFKGDWAIECAISRYQGLPALYVQHSRIEYVYVPTSLANHCFWGEEAEHRQRRLACLEEEIEDHPIFADPSGHSAAEIKKALLSYYKDNEDELKTFRIPLVSLFRDWNAVYDTCRAMAKQLDDKWMEPLWTLDNEAENNQETTLD